MKSAFVCGSTAPWLLPLAGMPGFGSLIAAALPDMKIHSQSMPAGWIISIH
jgi:hypothetical protein